MNNANLTPIRLVVHHCNNSLCGVYSDSPIPVEYVEMDGNVEDYSEEDVISTPEDGMFCGFVGPSTVNPDKVDRLFKLMGRQLPALQTKGLQYVRGQGKSCPECGQSSFQAEYGRAWVEGASCCVPFRCLNCLTQWTATFVLAGLADLTPGKPRILPNTFQYYDRVLEEAGSGTHEINIHGVKVVAISEEGKEQCEVDDANPMFYSAYLYHDGLQSCLVDCGKDQLNTLRQFCQALVDNRRWILYDLSAIHQSTVP